MEINLGLVCVGIFILGIIVLLVYNQIRLQKRKGLIRTFKASAVITEGNPILVKGTADSPSILLPSTGEKVAFYAIFIHNKKTSISSNSLTGNSPPFKAFDMSGDFSITSAGIQYPVRISSVFAFFTKGAAMTSSAVLSATQSSDYSKKAITEGNNSSIAETELNLVFGFSAPVSTSASSTQMMGQYDSSTSSSVASKKSNVDVVSNEYTLGKDTPKAITDILTKKGVAMCDGEEIIVVETYIPLNKEVFVFGTYEGKNGIIYSDNTTGLSVSYKDPETL